MPGRARGDRPKSCDLPWWPYVRENRACVCVGCSTAGMFVSSESKKISPVSGENVVQSRLSSTWRIPCFPSFARKKGGKTSSNEPTVKHQNPVITEKTGFFPGFAIRRMTAVLFARRACGVAMLMLRAKPPESWLTKVLANLDAVLIDHAHLERKAAQSALKLQRYQQLADSLPELTEIAIEELEHFNLVLKMLDDRGMALSQAISSPWISGMMNSVRRGRNEQVIDHLLCAAMIEGRSCEKFQILAEALASVDQRLAKFYGDLVESEGNHYASYLLMAKRIDELETERRLEFYLELDAELVVLPSDLPILH